MMRAWICGLALFLAPGPAVAGTVVLEAVERGRIFWTGLFTIPVLGPEEAYHAGRGNEVWSLNSFEAESRSVFVFDLSGFELAATAATLRVWSPGVGYRSSDRREQFSVHAVTTDPAEMVLGRSDLFTSWVDLGEGFMLAEGQLESAPGHWVEIPLDRTILRVLNRSRGRRITLGLSLSSLEEVPLWEVWEERVLTDTHGSGVPAPELVIRSESASLLPPPTLFLVDSARRGGPETGSTQFPFRTIAAAMDLATASDDVLVAPGRYEEGVIMKRGVDLLGSGAARTIIDISEGHPSVRCADATLDGFLVQHTPQRSEDGYWGAIQFRQAIDCPSGSSPVLSNVSVVTPGNGILLQDSQAVIRDCRVLAGLGEGFGAYGIIARESAPTITDCIVDALVAVSRTDTFDVVSEAVRIERNELRGRVDLFGFSDGELHFTNNLVLPPSAEPIFFDQYSGIELAYSTNAGLIAGNTLLGTSGLRIAWDRPSPARSSVTIVNNVVAHGSAGISVQRFYSPHQTILHNAVFGNRDDAMQSTDYRGIEDPSGTNGNLSDLPLGTLDGFEPAAGSALLEAGTNEFVEPDTVDVDGDPRVADADERGGAVVDIGAHEWQPGLLSVPIDLLPGRDNVLGERGAKMRNLPIAILSSEDLDAPLEVDAASLVVQGWPVLRDRHGDPVCKARTVDSDGAKDLVCFFPADALGGLAGTLLDRRLCLTGETNEGVPLKGCDHFVLGG